MRESTVIEIDGVFVGSAILQANREDRVFFAVHRSVGAMHRRVLPSLAEVHAQARQCYRLHCSLATRAQSPSP